MNTQTRRCMIICDNGQLISQKDKAVMDDNKQMKKTAFSAIKTFTKKYITILKNAKKSIDDKISIAKSTSESAKKLRNMAISAVFTGALVCLCAMFFTAGYDVYLNGECVGSVADKSDFERITEEVNAAAREVSGSSYGSIWYEPTYVMKISLRSAISSDDDLRASITKHSEVIRYGTTAIVDGNAVFTVGDKETLEKAIDDVIGSYGNGEAKLLTDVTFSGEYTEKNNLESYDSAYLKLRGLLKVETVKNVVYNEEIPFETSKVEDSQMYEGDEAVTVAGVPGKQRVVANVTYVNGIETSRNVVSAEEISPSCAQTVAFGTKKRPSDVGTGVMMMPFNGGISSRYGERSGRRTSHKGVDLCGATGSPVVAADNGKVIQAEYRYDYGNIIVVDHNNGLTTYYAHLNKINVAVGDVVEKGQKIGTVGSTGISTGPHLHFEVRRDGTPIDPYSYMN